MSNWKLLQMFHLFQDKIYAKNAKLQLGSKTKKQVGLPGSMAQWIRRLPTEQEILGSSPGRVKIFLELQEP